jgi:hypothetical protein
MSFLIPVLSHSSVETTNASQAARV